MDFEAPPPLVGALEEPPDVECESRVTLDDEEDVSEQELEIPIDLPCSSCSPPEVPPIPFTIKGKPPEVKVGDEPPDPPADSEAPHSDYATTNGLSSEIGSVHTASDFDPFSTARSIRESDSIASAKVEDHSSNVDEVEKDCLRTASDRDSFAKPSSTCAQNYVSKNSEPPTAEEPAAGEQERKDRQTASQIDAVPTEDTDAESMAGEEQVVEEDDFDDDFGDFVDAEVVEVGKGSTIQSKTHEVGSDSWSAFNRSEPEPQPVATTSARKSEEAEEWDAFNTVNDSGKAESWEADFDVFGEASSPREVAVEKPMTDEHVAEMESSPVLDELCDSMDLWNVDSEIGGDEAMNITELLDAEKPEKSECDSLSLDRSFDLWFALRIVEDALALKFEWKGSQHGSNLFKTLRVDPNAVGRGSLPPLSTSTVLEPVPFTANGTTRRTVIISREEGAYGAKVVASDAASANVLPSSNYPVVAESPSIPQADFDWDQADLRNPTTAANRSSALLDVDFLSANSGGGSSSTISTLQKELDQLGLSSTPPQTLPKPPSQPSMLDMLMASATKASKRNNRPPSELSLDARALHDQLPDIDFLRANMIMFPLGGGRSSPT